MESASTPNSAHVHIRQYSKPPLPSSLYHPSAAALHALYIQVLSGPTDISRILQYDRVQTPADIAFQGSTYIVRTQVSPLTPPFSQSKADMYANTLAHWHVYTPTRPGAAVPFPVPQLDKQNLYPTRFITQYISCAYAAAFARLSHFHCNNSGPDSRRL